ncbi:non-ribosomal peptide synthetase [Serratia microhaemolytica]|uniref:non-ribosomal peptide synthetase n=1 Tax=Serratia microhaemolytica TaxID=2675110 RepID=UPI0023EA609B|nr:non-ribosomal peptide synthetase [Serratia microhaemolytica]
MATRAQQRMLLVEKNIPELNRVLHAYQEIEGDLDLQRLTTSVDILISKLPLLQTRFAVQEGKLWQIYDHSLCHALVICDLRQDAEPLATAHRNMQQSVAEAKETAVTSDGALYNFTLYIIDNKKFILSMWGNHVLIDGRSFALLEQLLTKIYNNAFQLDKIESHFKGITFDATANADYQYQQSSAKLKDELFWRNYIDDLKYDAFTWTGLSTIDKCKTYRYSDSIPFSQRQQIQALSLACGVSEQILFLSSAVLLIRALIDQPCFSVSIPVPGTGKLVSLGMTSNVLPLRIHLPETLSLSQALQALSKEVKTVVRHQRYRVEDVLQLSETRATAGFGPIINVMIFDRGEGFAQCRSVSRFAANKEGLELQMTFWGSGREEGIDLLFEDVTPGHSTEHLAQLSNKLQSILRFLSQHPEKTVAELIADCQLDDDQILQHSLYFQRRQQPAAGFLQWQLSAEILARQVAHSSELSSAALTFAPPRMLLADRVILITQLECRVSPQPQALAGTLLAIEASGWLVAVGQGAVYLTGLQDEKGNPLSAPALATQSALQIGSQLPLISSTQAQQLSAGRQRALKQQNGWKRYFTAPQLAQLSAQTNQDINTQAQWQKTTSYRVERDADQSTVNAFELLAAWMIYLARDHSNRGERFQLGWQQTNHANMGDDSVERLFTALCPFDIEIDLSHSFAQIVAQLTESYQNWRSLPRCLVETVHLHIRLGQHWLAKPRPWPLAIVFAEPTESTIELAQQAVGEQLTLHIDPCSADFYWVYDAQQISAQQIARLSSHLLRLLTAAKQPDAAPCPVGKLPFLAPEEQRQLQAWGEHPTAASTEATTLPALFRAQLTDHAEAIALRYGDQTLSYRELNQRANRLAHRLIAHGVQPEQRVALCVARSIELMIAMLAILKAGGAYVPLDPAYPSERLRYILQDAEPCLLLVDQAGSAVLGQHTTPTLQLEAALFTSGRADDPELATLTPDNLAYLIYTSGSTGQPKGVMIEHRNVTRLFSADQPGFNFSSTDTWALFHSYNFDASVWEIWAPLSHGSTLCIVPNEALTRLAEFDQFVAEQQITVLCVTTSALKTMLQQSDRLVTLPCLQRIVLVGEEAEAETLRLCTAGERGLQVINAYGPTETGVYATLWSAQQLTTNQRIVPIGQPMNQTAIYLLDSEQQPVPAGSIGEIYIGGSGVARGYFKQAELTAQRFLPDPFSDQPSARLYRTGDLARWQGDGQLLYLGRNDQQVKIRGFRVEPGEIASQLKLHPAVSEAVVVARGERHALQLVAYVIADNRQHIEPIALRQHLAQRLPAYMLPIAYVPISTLPLTSNGKLDKRALPEPTQQAFARAEYVAPQGEIERNLAALWCELLEIERVSRHDNFFALGGHSLLAVRLCSRVQQRFGLSLSVTQLFSHSTLAALAGVLATLPAQRLPAIARLPRTQPLPLSFAQQRLWFLWQMEGPSATYNIPALVMLHGELQRDALIASLNTLYARYDAWRSTFVLNQQGEGEVVLLAPESGLPLIEHDLSASANAEQQLAQLSDQQAHQPFDLSQGPLVRAALVKLAEQQSALLLTQHHIISDGWSLGVICQELTQLYNGYCQRQTVSLPLRQIDYPDYAAWQRQWLSGERLKQQSDYWYQQLQGAPERLTLPTDYPRPTEQSYQGSRLPFALDATLSEQLRQLSRQQGVTLFITLLAAWSVVLTRLAGQDEVVIGSPVANRGRSELEGVIGFFANTLALRLQPERSQDVAQLLRQVREQVSQAQAHQDLPFEQVVERLNPVRQRSYAPLFQVLLSWQAQQLSLPLDRLTVTIEDNLYQRVKFDLELTLTENPQGIICGQMAYASALFSAESITRHLAYLQRVLSAMVNRPTEQPSATHLLSQQEYRQLVMHYNQTQIAYPPLSIGALFAQQAARRPDAIAIRDQQQSLSYAQLNRRVNQLAHALLARGIGANQCVALRFESSLEMVVAILAVLKTGAAYVPLDLGNPEQRTRQIIDDCAANWLLSHSALAALPASSAKLLLIDQLAISHQPASEPAVTVTSQQLAYVMYTSGTTGVAKGVMIRHNSIIRTVCNTNYLALTEDDICLLAANYAFDGCVFDLFGALLNGSQLIVPQRSEVLDLQRLAQLIEQRGVTSFFLTTSLFNLLVEQQLPRLQAVRQILFGGEAASLKHIEQALRYLGPGKLINCYGPTETTVLATAHIVEQLAPDLGSLPIGKPVGNAQIYLLDQHQQLVPHGCRGEIYIGGDGVANGYLNRSELNAEKFIRSPFNPTERLYRTGDLGRWQADGSLLYLGRCDNQVKLRGFRIELDEIRSVLLHYPGIRQCVVQMIHDSRGVSQLCAWLLVDELAQFDRQSLLATLRARLPGYMIPSAIIPLAALPLNPNGKVDLKALPAPTAQAFAHAEYAAPQREIEQHLAAIWCELLAVERVSRHDDFFALGGHSLLAIKLCSRVQQRLGVALTVTQLFSHSTLAALADVVAALPQQTLPAIVRLTAQQRLSLSFAQQRLWFLWQMEGPSATYNIPLVLKLQGQLKPAALIASLNALYARHEAWRSTFTLSPQGEAELVLLPAEPGLPVITRDLSTHPDRQQQLAQLTDAESEQAFDLSCGPLVRAQLVKMAPQQWYLLLTQHHIISDGWSIGVICQELSQLYNAHCQQQKLTLPALPIDYPDYAAWQRQWLSGERLTQQSDYWQQQLQGAPELLTLPTDHPRPALQSHIGGSFRFTLDAQLSAQLRQFSRQQGVTPFMTLLAAWSLVLARLAGQDDVVIGSPVANRGRSELEPLVGFFANTLALRIKPTGEQSVVQLLQQVRARVTEAQAHQDLPFEQVVERLNPQRQRSYAPIFQTLLSWQQHQALPVFEQLQLEIAEANYQRVKFDLELELTEQADGTLQGQLAYASALFERQRIASYADYLQRVLSAMVSQPEQRVAAITLLSEQQQTTLLSLGHGHAPPATEIALLPALFEAQVLQHANATALRCGQHQLSYDQLNRQANRLAHQLIALGVTPEQPVALCCQRSVAMIVGLLAILKAGGVYLPLDPLYPSARLGYILQDAEPCLLLADQVGRNALGEHTVATLALENALLTSGEESNPQVATLSASNLAYLIYTSGSTGQPKGVMVEHQQIVNFVMAVSEMLSASIDQPVRALLNFSIMFDASWCEFAALFQGGELTLTPVEEKYQPAKTLARLIAERTNYFSCTQSQLEGLVNAGALEQITDPLLIFVGGEVFPTELWQRLQQAKQIKTVNAYGPTETTVAVTSAALQANASSQPVIGRSFANARIYLLDNEQQLVPPGSVGEICIGGSGVARGYFKRADLTAQRFLPDRFSTEPGARLYRSGDLARWQADGQLVFVGRNDEQVKIRGFRIELGEIAAQLNQHPSVSEAVVVTHDAADNRQLVAYLIANPGQTIDALTLRQHLAARLPDYMLPVAYVAISELPLTPNGKLDKHALPEPNAQAFARSEYVAPEGEIEQQLAAIWGELLAVERISRHDNFFALGGHSLLAIKLCSRVQQRLGVSLAVTQLFSHSTLAALASVLTQLPQQPLPEITRLPRNQHLPLSFSQQRLWFLWQMEGPSANYNMPALLSLRGELQPDALIASLNTLYARYESWRSSFSINSQGEAEVVLLGEESGVPLQQQDLSALPNPTQRLAQLTRQQAHQPFDLSRGPLVRAQLFKLGQQQWYLLLTQHHIISDGWSIGVIWQELSQLYNAYCQGVTANLRRPRIDYPDYAAWQRQWLSGERLKQQSDYWYQQLQDAPELLTLPTDYPRPPQQSYQGERQAFAFDAALSEQLRQFSRQQQVTPFMLLLAAWSIVLTRLAGQQEVVIGSPVANRAQSEWEGVVGFFVNTLALRIKPDRQQDVLHLLTQVREQVTQAQAHQDLPFEQVVERLNPERQRSYTPIFQVLLTWQQHEPLPQFDQLQVATVEVDYQRVKCDLELGFGEDSAGIIHGRLGYASALFNADSITRYISYLQRVLRAMISAPTQSLSAITLLSADERRALLSLGQSSEAPAPATTLPALFVAQLSKHSTAVALRSGDRTLSYQQLNGCANRLAHRLIAQGVQPEQRVALCAARSIEQIIALLAILKAGAAYVPLDPNYPSERLHYILQDAEPMLLLLDQEGKAVLGEHNIPTLMLEPALFTHGNQDNPQLPTLTPDNLAYLIYTSGSTGQPKGVMVEHRNISNFLIANAEMLSASLSQPICQLINFSIMFDASWFELAVLFHGGQLVLTAPHDKYDPDKSVRHLAASRANAFCCTPSQLEGLLQAGLEQQLVGDTLLLIGGEAISSELWQRLQQMPKITCINLYGPTETTIAATRAAITAHGTAQPVIGNTFANAQIYLLDSERQPVAPGAVGEIYIGGAGVARGYFKRADLTAERFLPDPFSAEPGARLYRSGDLARWRADGQLVYLGRNDEQVKIRGFRIELGEIAAQLSQHPAVSDAVVVAQGEANALQLVAYLIAQPGQRIEPMKLREYLAARLPDYMLPVAYVAISELPLTPNGKLDKRALPEPNAQAFARSEYVAPEGEIEQQLAAIWSELLAVERISRHDNFFALGGHSLLVVKMCDLIGKRLGKTALVATVFAASTLAALAASLQGKAFAVQDAEAQMAQDRHLPALSFISASEVAFEHILLTGAAGFLGIYLLAELQQQHPQATVHCVVRGEQGLERLRQAAQRYQLTLDEQRLKVITGDLSAVRLGVSARCWQQWAQQIDAIYHCGAWVNHLHSYHTLRDSNVQSTTELLALCCQGRAKQLFYISTLSAAAQQGNRLCEALVAETLSANNGYVQTKWVCEHLMMQAFARGLHGAIYRMGNITGATQHGASNVEHNHVLNVMKGCLQMGVVPDWRENSLDISPVDRLAALVVSAGRRTPYLDRALNLGYLVTLSWQHLFQYLSHQGYSVRFVSPESWSRDWVADINSDNALYPFKAFYLSLQAEALHQPVDIVEKVLVDEASENFDINQLLEIYYHYWRQSGFLPAPEQLAQQNHIHKIDGEEMVV